MMRRLLNGPTGIVISVGCLALFLFAVACVMHTCANVVNGFQQ